MPRTSHSAPAKIVAFLREPPFPLEIALWLVLAALVIGIRVYLWHLLPVYSWSGDADSYAHGAFHWLDTGEMIFDGRRGPVYTLFIAVALKCFGSLNGVPLLQHGLGALAILGVIGVTRVVWGRVTVLPLFACGVALGLYGLPLHLGQLIRNETMLFILSSATFGAWWLALRRDSKVLLFCAALAVGLGIMTKNVFLPLPLFILGGAVLYGGEKWKAKMISAALVVAGLALPTVALKIHDSYAWRVAVPQPQAGLLFYGRTAQWTVLDGGIEPELKARIYDEVQDYKRRPKLDNNIILKRTVVPHLWQELQKRGQSPTDLDRLCRQLAIEAVRAHPREFWNQFRGDLYRLHIKSGVKNEFPSEEQLTDAEKYLSRHEETKGMHPGMQQERSLETVHRALAAPQAFDRFHDLLSRSWLFQYYPVLVTTLALPLMVLLTKGKDRFFFLGAASMWYANMILLSTVGRPLERYLMPLVPIMFWAQSGVLILAWSGLLRLAGGLTSPPPSPTTSAPQEP